MIKQGNDYNFHYPVFIFPKSIFNLHTTYGYTLNVQEYNGENQQEKLAAFSPKTFNVFAQNI